MTPVERRTLLTLTTALVLFAFSFSIASCGADDSSGSSTLTCVVPHTSTDSAGFAFVPDSDPDEPDFVRCPEAPRRVER